MIVPVLEINDQEVKIHVQRVLEALGDLRPAFAGPVNQAIDDFFTKQFDTEGQHGGLKWEPLRPVTQMLRQRRGHGRGGILHDTGRLRASLEKGGKSAEGEFAVTKSSLRRGTRVPYGRFHQTGSVLKTLAVGKDAQDQPIIIRLRGSSVRVPARPIVPDRIPDAIVDQWAKLVGDYLEKQTQ